MRLLDYLAIAGAVTGVIPGLYAQGGDPKALQQALNAQFTMTKVAQNRIDIVTAGTVLLLQKSGLMMYSTTSPMPPMNTYKNGKISQGLGGFGRDIAITAARGGEGTAADLPQRKFSSGEGLWITEAAVQKDAIVLQLYSDMFDEVRYYGQLKIPFEKHSVPSSDDALAKIAEVLTIKPPDNSADAAPSQAPPANVLQNQDVLKMVKAGLDDSIIVAKIKSSQCQFDTTPDALIALKQSGVSSAVLKAMTLAARQP